MKFPIIDEEKNKNNLEQKLELVIDYMLSFAGEWVVFHRAENDEFFIMETKINNCSIWICGVHNIETGSVDFDSHYSKEYINYILEN